MFFISVVTSVLFARILKLFLVVDFILIFEVSAILTNITSIWLVQIFFYTSLRIRLFDQIIFIISLNLIFFLYAEFPYYISYVILKEINKEIILMAFIALEFNLIIVSTSSLNSENQ